MTDEITTTNVSVGSLRAYLARPEVEHDGGMLLLPMVSGIGAQVREFAADIARAGVSALSWDPWHGVSSDDTPVSELFERMSRLDDEEALAEQERLLDYLFGELGLRRVGVIGWCLGGRFALLLGGRQQRLANVVAYHPTVPIPPAPNHTLSAVEHSTRITAPVMMLYPGDDHLVPRQSFDELQSALNGRSQGASLVHLYPVAEHGFSARDHQEQPASAAAAAVSWPQVLSFIQVTTGR